MGTLKPGATYIYERDGRNIYAREFGTTTRQLIGYDYPNEPDIEKGLRNFKEEQLWIDILLVAQTNPSLQAELDRVKVLWELIQNEQSS